MDEAVEVVTPECGVGWKLAGSNCYKFVSDLVTYKFAEQTCQNQAPDSNLLYITSNVEASALRGAFYLFEFLKEL